MWRLARLVARAGRAAQYPPPATPAASALRYFQALLDDLAPDFVDNITEVGGQDVKTADDVAERIATRLQAAGFSPTVIHRDLGSAPQDALEGAPRR